MLLNTCAIIGDKPSRFSFGYDEEHPYCLQIKNALLEQISALYFNGIRRFITGCDQGAAMWAGEVVAQVKQRVPDMELVCVLPYENQSARWSADFQTRHLALRQASTMEIVLQPHFSEDCYARRNRFIVNNASFIVAVFDQKEALKGQTRCTIEYARAKGRGIIYVDPKTAQITPMTVHV